MKTRRCIVLVKQVFLLLHKNFTLQIRRPLGTVFELLLPVLAMSMIIAVRFSGPVTTNIRNLCFLTFEPDHLTVPDTPPLNLSHYTVYYTPVNNNTLAVVSRMHERLGLSGRLLVNGVNNETVMVEMLTAMKRADTAGCFEQGVGIVFEEINHTYVEYTIRLGHEAHPHNTWFTSYVGPFIQAPGARISPNTYLAEGFLHIQNAVSLSLIEVLTNKEIDLQVSVVQFPYPKHRRNFFLLGAGIFIPIAVIISFIYSASSLIKELVLEKETRVRETMLMMGLKQWVLWSTWYLKQMMFLLIIVFLVSLLIKFGQLFPKSDFFLIFILFAIYSFSATSFAFLVSVWFDSSRLALIAGFLSWVINFVPFFFLQFQFDTLSLGLKVGSCLLSNTCMGLGMEVISRLEQREEGLQWTNIAGPLSVNDQFNVCWVMGMLLVDSIVYMLFAWYIDQVKPGRYGLPKPIYFFFLPSYWAPRNKVYTEVGEEEKGFDPSAHEKVSENLKVGISIRNITKIYNQSLPSKLFNSHKESHRLKAVSNLSLNMYKGQITALLGHNGAGKTTTMSILTGLYTPTSGSATINGFDILTDMDQVRRSLGICPQHNILFDRLTVSEHLSFFLKLKGIFDSAHSKSEVESMIKELQLMDKANVQAGNLSGGQKRKLSVGIALIGGSEVVILDEPTSGMDPYARRATWDLLTKHKEQRTILLTTHFMDEADLLGDRIAIMAEGKLRCSGSSLFLKSRYGVGYHLTFVKECCCNSSYVEQLVKSFIIDAKKVTDVGAELSFILPSSFTPLFPSLFDRLENDKVALGIQNFGISITTMEEVFMKVGEGRDKKLKLYDHCHYHKKHKVLVDSLVNVGVQFPLIVPEQISKHENLKSIEELELASLDKFEDKRNISPLSSQESVDVDPENDFVQSTHLKYCYTANSGVVLWFQQLYALLLKKSLHFVRLLRTPFTQLAFPIICVVIAMVLAMNSTNSSDSKGDPSRKLHITDSAFNPKNLAIFHAQFGDSDYLNFTKLDSTVLGVSKIVDITEDVTHLMNKVASNLPNRTEDCCKYSNQLLDQFCATRSQVTCRGRCEVENTSYVYRGWGN